MAEHYHSFEPENIFSERHDMMVLVGTPGHYSPAAIMNESELSVISNMRQLEEHIKGRVSLMEALTLQYCQKGEHFMEATIKYNHIKDAMASEISRLSGIMQELSKSLDMPLVISDHPQTEFLALPMPLSVATPGKSLADDVCTQYLGGDEHILPENISTEELWKRMESQESDVSGEPVKECKESPEQEPPKKEEAAKEPEPTQPVLTQPVLTQPVCAALLLEKLQALEPEMGTSRGSIQREKSPKIPRSLEAKQAEENALRRKTSPVARTIKKAKDNHANGLLKTDLAEVSRHLKKAYRPIRANPDGQPVPMIDKDNRFSLTCSAHDSDYMVTESSKYSLKEYEAMVGSAQNNAFRYRNFGKPNHQLSFEGHRFSDLYANMTIIALPDGGAEIVYEAVATTNYVPHVMQFKGLFKQMIGVRIEE